MKGGQVGIFVLVGVALTIAVVLVYFLVFSFQEDSIGGLKDIDSDFIQPVTVFSDCLQENANFSLRNVMLHGGFFNVSQRGVKVPIVGEYEKLETSKLFELFEGLRGISPYWVVNGKVISPSLKRVEKEIGESIYFLDSVCFETVDQFKEFNYTVGEKKIDVLIEEEGVTFNFEYSVSFFNGELSYVLPKFSYFINSSATGLINDASGVINSLQANSSIVDLSLLESLDSNVVIHSYEGDLFFEMWRDDETITFLAKV
jgi:hypothetical protein